MRFSANNNRPDMRTIANSIDAAGTCSLDSFPGASFAPNEHGKARFAPGASVMEQTDFRAAFRKSPMMRACCSGAANDKRRQRIVASTTRYGPAESQSNSQPRRQADRVPRRREIPRIRNGSHDHFAQLCIKVEAAVGMSPHWPSADDPGHFR